jgi:hypothetical protein
MIRWKPIYNRATGKVDYLMLPSSKRFSFKLNGESFFPNGWTDRFYFSKCRYVTQKKPWVCLYKRKRELRLLFKRWNNEK